MKHKLGLLILSLVLVVGTALGAVSCQAKPMPAPSPTTPKLATPSPAAPSPTAPKPTAPSPTAPSPAAPMKWKAQASTTATAFGYLYYAKTFVNTVVEQSKGQITIELFPSGAVVDPYEQVTATAKGALDVGFGLGGFATKQVPEGEIEQGLPGAFADVDEFFDFMMNYKDGAFYKLLAEAYREKGVQLFKSCCPWNQVIISKRPIRSVDEIKGKKIRAPGSYAQLVKNLGAAPVELATQEIFMALQTGTIDGTINGDYMIGTAKFWDVAKGLLMPSLGPSTMDVYVNQKTYDSLPKELQKLLVDAAVKASNTYLTSMKRDTGDILNTAAKQYGVEITTLPGAEFAKVRKAAEPILDKAATLTPRSAKLVELIREYIATKK